MNPGLLRALIALCLTFISLPAIAGCGGGSREATAEQVPRLTKAQLANKLSDICEEHSYRQVGAVEEFDKEHGWPYGSHRENATEKQLETELTVVILPIVRNTIREIEGRVRPPRSEEAKLEAFIGALEHGIQVSEDEPIWVTGTTGEEPFRRARALSWALGTASCGQA
jgi:hypothetical protein